MSNVFSNIFENSRKLRLEGEAASILRNTYRDIPIHFGRNLSNFTNFREGVSIKIETQWWRKMVEMQGNTRSHSLNSFRSIEKCTEYKIQFPDFTCIKLFEKFVVPLIFHLLKGNRGKSCEIRKLPRRC